MWMYGVSECVYVCSKLAHTQKWNLHFVIITKCDGHIHTYNGAKALEPLGEETTTMCDVLVRLFEQFCMAACARTSSAETKYHALSERVIVCIYLCYAATRLSPVGGCVDFECVCVYAYVFGCDWGECIPGEWNVGSDTGNRSPGKRALNKLEFTKKSLVNCM